MTIDDLQGRNKKELAEMARKKGIQGWHGMRKDELVAALAALPADTRRDRRPRLDVGAAAVLAGGLFLAVFALTVAEFFKAEMLP